MGRSGHTNLLTVLPAWVCPTWHCLRTAVRAVLFCSNVLTTAYFTVGSFLYLMPQLIYSLLRESLLTIPECPICRSLSSVFLDHITLYTYLVFTWSLSVCSQHNRGPLKSRDLSWAAMSICTGRALYEGAWLRCVKVLISGLPLLTYQQSSLEENCPKIPFRLAVDVVFFCPVQQFISSV